MYSLAVFQPHALARLLILTAAIEALIQPALRDKTSVDHVAQLIKMTLDSSIAKDDKASLLSQLGHMKRNSIRQTGQLLARERLPGRVYMEMESGDFFDHVYSMRSNIVHAKGARPTRQKVLTTAYWTQWFVACVFQRSWTPISV